MSQPRDIQQADIRLAKAYWLLASILDHKLTRIEKENLKKVKRLIAEAARDLLML